MKVADRRRKVEWPSSLYSRSWFCNLRRCTTVLAWWRPHLQALAAVRVRAGVDAVLEALEHDALDVRARERQDVAQALVPGLERAQPPRVLPQPLRQREQQLARPVPGCRGNQKRSVSVRQEQPAVCVAAHQHLPLFEAAWYWGDELLTG